MAALPPFSLLHWNRWVDSLGAAGAFLCAVHCALLPVALVLPAVGLGALSSQVAEQVFVLISTVLALASCWQAWRRHGAYHAGWLVGPGLALVWAGLLYPPLHHSAWPHAGAMALGGSLIALAHLFNLRLSQGHSHGVSCTS